MSNHKVALITGAARRIGAALVKQLHTAQYNIIIHYHHSDEAAQQLCRHCCATRTHSAVALPANLNKLTDIKNLIIQAQQAWGRLDVLINNAARFYPTTISETTEDEWHDLFSSNLMAPYFLAQAAYPYLQQTQGCIINLSDANASRPLKNYGIYSSTKAALNTLTQSLAIEFAPIIRVNAIAPGPTLWPEGKGKLSETDKEKVLNKTPLNKQADIKDITQTALFLIQNKHITGQIITIDGGKSLVS